MKSLTKMLGAMLAATMTVGASFAGDDVSEMKSTVDSMKAEMSAMKADFDAQRAAWRSHAGGAPEGLLSANGNATIRIGGDFRTQYSIGWSNGYKRGGNYKSTSAGWAVSKALLAFDVDLSADTSAHIELRPDGKGTLTEGANILDRAYWEWKNVGGAGFGLTVGLASVPFGMSNNTDIGGYDWGGLDRALITEPLYAGGGSGFAGQVFGANLGAKYADGSPVLDPAGDQIFIDVSPYTLHGIPYAPGSIGIFTSYNWDDQIILKAGIFASGISGYHNNTLAGNPGYTNHNEIRNLGFSDHVVAVGYNPCYIEGLHLEASYMGTFDSGKKYFGDTSNPRDPNFPVNVHADDGYQSAFSIGAAYSVNEALRVAAEAVMTWNPQYFDGYAYGLALTADYSLTEKFVIGAGFDYLHVNFPHTENTLRAMDYLSRADKYVNVFRFSVGAKYDFGNGIYVRGQYLHDFVNATGFFDGNSKDADTIILETGYTF